MSVATLLLFSWVAALALGIRPTATATEVTEWSAESRTVLSFRVKESSVQALLPEGWTVAPSTAPANRGANLNVTAMERMLVLDPQGRPSGSGTSRYVVLGVPARHSQTNQTGTLIVGGISPEGPGAYEVYLTASVSRMERESAAEAEEHGRTRESWEFATAGGDRIELRLAYRRALPARSHAEAVVRSGKRPELSRTYRIDQATDLVKSTALAVDRLDEFLFRATGPRFAALFDGSEALLSVTAVPWYVREISVP